MPNTSSEQSAFHQALSAHRIWGLMRASATKALAGKFSLQNAEAKTLLIGQGSLHTQLGWVLQGQVELVDPDLGVRVSLRTGDLFGYGATPKQHIPTMEARAASDCKIAWLVPQDLRQACQENPELQYFFSSLLNAPSAAGAAPPGDSLNLLTTSIRALVKRAPITVSPALSIRDTAKMMRDLRVSSVLVVEQGLLFGLVTDRDLRNRVVADGMDTQRPVSDITTLAPMTVSANSPAFEALLLMARHNIHHVPVMDGSHILGMITTTDLTEQHSTSAVYLAGDIFKQSSIQGLKTISGRVKQLQQHLAAADASAYSTGHIITAITDAITTRLIHLAEGALGPAPIEYLWVAAGSQARNEQTAKSDQDNCLILDDTYKAEIHGEYFRSFSKWVCDGLAECGYIHCPGEMMAMTDTWRQPQSVWIDYFSRWIEQPKPKSLMLTCVFFDLRAIHGKAALLENLREAIVQRTRGNSLFLAHMVGNALKHRPPLGIFGQISLIKGGEHPNTLDLKHTGIVPIVDLARIYALAGGIPIANTHDRLEQSVRTHEISEQSARDLRDALEFLGKLRVAHQARQTTQGLAPDNFLSLDELSNFERSHLKSAFEVVQALQGVLQQRYGGRY